MLGDEENFDNKGRKAAQAGGPAEGPGVPQGHREAQTSPAGTGNGKV